MAFLIKETRVSEVRPTIEQIDNGEASELLVRLGTTLYRAVRLHLPEQIAPDSLIAVYHCGSANRGRLEFFRTGADPLLRIKLGKAARRKHKTTAANRVILYNLPRTPNSVAEIVSTYSLGLGASRRGKQLTPYVRSFALVAA